MLVSKQFIKQFAFLANYYKWDKSDIDEIKTVVRSDKTFKKYLESLANAHKNGYQQTKENGHVRLKDWCIEKGLDDPYRASFDPHDLDLMAAQEHKLLK